jgi:hypothetical protein
MKSRMTKLAAAALIVIAVLVGVRQFDGPVSLTGVAWGEVIKNVEQVQTVAFRKWESQMHAGQQEARESEMMVYASTDYGIRMDTFRNGQVAINTYSILKDKAIVSIVHPMKMYDRRELPEAEAMQLRRMHPKELVRQFMSSQYRHLGRKEVDGVQVEGIETNDPEVVLSGTNVAVDGITGRLWVGVETGLPVSLEVEIIGAGGALEIKSLMDEFQWGIELAAGDFKPDIPADYSMMGKAVAAEINGPQNYDLDDGSVVKLAEDAKIELYTGSEKRGFEHLAGEIEVTVAETAREFVVTTAFGTVKALGTIFTMDLIDAVPEESSEEIEMLAVSVKEGSVEVSNSEGSRIITDNQSATIEKNREPYDFRKDEDLPARLVERIQAMLDAFAAGDKRAWIANFNIKAFYDLVKGNIEYSDHPDWFSGMSADDAKRIREEFANADVKSPEEMAERAAATVNIDEPKKVYVQSVTLNPDGKHATARCVEVKGHRRYTVTTPQWTYFDNNWWQTDD